jgi:beta-N-acetylhexosaminidase
MTNEFNPGQFTILGFKGITPDPEFLSLIEKFPPAGFLLLGDNYESPRQLASLVSHLKEFAGDKIFIAVDQEPGRVSRFKSGFPVSRNPSHYVKQYLEDDFRVWCAETASKLAEAGVNLNLAPVLDLAVFSNPNPVLAERVFGDDPEIVSVYARVFMEEHKKRGVLTCGKHFPGLGSARFDPHERLSVSHEPFERFEKYHWKPFISAVEHDVDMIMTTHLRAESIDPRNAATYSRKIVEIIRKQLGFSGPVISDDLIMGGAAVAEGISESALKSLRSGHNLVIISRHLELQTKALDSIKNSYAQDHLFSKIANQNEKIIRRFQDSSLL